MLLFVIGAWIGVFGCVVDGVFRVTCTCFGVTWWCFCVTCGDFGVSCCDFCTYFFCDFIVFVGMLCGASIFLVLSS